MKVYFIDADGKSYYEDISIDAKEGSTDFVDYLFYKWKTSSVYRHDLDNIAVFEDDCLSCDNSILNNIASSLIGKKIYGSVAIVCFSSTETDWFEEDLNYSDVSEDIISKIL